MKKDLNEEIETENNRFDQGVVGFETKMENNKKFKWLVYGLVFVSLGVIFGILAGTGVI